MTTVTDELLRSMTEVIVKTLHPERIILFGSHARRDARESSDIDLLVVTSEPFGKDHSRLKETGRLYRELIPFLVSKDILLYSHEEVNRWKDTPRHIIATSLREGKVLYERQR